MKPCPPGSPSQKPPRLVLWFLGALWAVLSLNLLLTVARFQVNVLTWDQWDFFAPLFNGGSLWDLFRYQHGPHRQGISFVLTSFILGATHWDTRVDSLWIASLLSFAGLLALRLKWKLTGSLSIRDGWIPILALSLGQFETILIAPNASHSAGPFALIMLAANLWLSPRIWLRYLLAGLIAVCLTFTGFGLFAGAMLTGLLLVAAARHAFARETNATLAAGLGFVLALAGWLLFRSDYIFQPAVADFKFPWQPVTDYFRFIALMLLQPVGIASGTGAQNYLVGTILSAVVLATGVFLLWHWLRARKPSPALDVMVLLLGAGVLFVCNTAVGRISLGIAAGMSSRYSTLMLPIWLAVYFVALSANRKWAALAAGVLLWCIALWPYRDLITRPVAQWPGTIGATDDQAKYFEFYTTNKAAWVDQYLQLHSANAAQQVAGSFVYPAPDATHMDDKLRFLREHQFSFFADGAAPRSYLPWLVRERTIWNDEFPSANLPHTFEDKVRLTFVSRRDGFLDIPLAAVSRDAATIDLEIETSAGRHREHITLPVVLSVPVRGGLNTYTLSYLPGPNSLSAHLTLRAGPVQFSVSAPTNTSAAPAPKTITARPPATRDTSVNPSALALLASWLLVAAIVAGPALASYLWLQSRQIVDERLLIIAPLVVVGLLGYLGFFVFYASALLGKVFALGVAAAAWTFVTRQLRRSPRPPWNQAATVPLLLAIGLSLFYLALLYLPALGQPFARQSAFRFMHELPTDAILPQMVGDRLYAGESLRPFYIDWLSSDRPPLQAGLYLLVLPWLQLLNLPAALGYQCLGTFAQLVWVPAAWLLARALGLDRFRAVATVLLVALVGFFIVNSTFAWPKLLAAGFVVFAGTLLLGHSQPLPRRVVLLAAACAALGWLSHGTAAFSLLALGLFCAFGRRLSWKNLAAAAALFALIAGPWTLYQKFCDPPGNRLLKYHLAAVTPVDARGTLETLRDVYAPLTWKTWVANKRYSAGLLVNGRFGDLVHFFSTSPRERRIDEFFYVSRAIGVLNLAWLVCPLVWLIRRRGPPAPRLAAELAGWTLVTFAVWIAVMFDPTSTVLHQGSYAAVLVACVLAAGLLLELPLWVSGVVLGWHALYGAVTWLPYYGTAPLNRSMFLVFLLALAPLAAALRLASRTRRTDPKNPPENHTCAPAAAKSRRGD